MDDGVWTGVVIRTAKMPEDVQAKRPNTECLTVTMCAACMGDYNTLGYLIEQGGHKDLCHAAGVCIDSHAYAFCKLLEGVQACMRMLQDSKL